MNIMVSGIGGIGGYIASVLCAHESDVTLVARRKRRQSLEKNGLILHSLLMGERVFHPAVRYSGVGRDTRHDIYLYEDVFPRTGTAGCYTVHRPRHDSSSGDEWCGS